MSFTEEELNWLNQYVYKVDPDTKSNEELKAPQVGKKITVKNGTEVYVVAMKDDDNTGFQGMAVAPIVNGKPDYSQVTVVAAGTDSSDPTDIRGAKTAMTPTGSPQSDIAINFISN